MEVLDLDKLKLEAEKELVSTYEEFVNTSFWRFRRSWFLHSRITQLMSLLESIKLVQDNENEFKVVQLLIKHK